MTLEECVEQGLWDLISAGNGNAQTVAAAAEDLSEAVSTLIATHILKAIADVRRSEDEDALSDFGKGWNAGLDRIRDRIVSYASGVAE